MKKSASILWSYLKIQDSIISISFYKSELTYSKWTGWNNSGKAYEENCTMITLKIINLKMKKKNNLSVNKWKILMTLIYSL